jgi:hypothetical protein
VYIGGIIKMKILLPLVVLVFLSACTSIDVNRIDGSQYSVKSLCIEENKDTTVLKIIEDTASARGINTSIYREKLPIQCEYSLLYTTDYRWDLVSFLSDAQFFVKKNDTEIASAKYHHYGGFDFSKFKDSESKLTPVLESLFIDFKRVTKAPEDKMLSNKYNSLREAKKLLDEGVITQEEFQREKAKFFADTK